MSTTLTADDLAAVKTRQQATWASGDYAVIGTTLQVVGENLCESLDVRAGRTSLEQELVTLATRANRCGRDALAIDSTYIEVLATKRQRANRRCNSG